MSEKYAMCQLLENGGHMVFTEEELDGLTPYIPSDCQNLTIRIENRADEVWLMDFFEKLEGHGIVSLNIEHIRFH